MKKSKRWLAVAVYWSMTGLFWAVIGGLGAALLLATGYGVWLCWSRPELILDRYLFLQPWWVQADLVAGLVVQLLASAVLISGGAQAVGDLYLWAKYELEND